MDIGRDADSRTSHFCVECMQGLAVARRIRASRYLGQSRCLGPCPPGLPIATWLTPPPRPLRRMLRQAQPRRAGMLRGVGQVRRRRSTGERRHLGQQRELELHRVLVCDPGRGDRARAAQAARLVGVVFFFAGGPAPGAPGRGQAEVEAVPAIEPGDRGVLDRGFRMCVVPPLPAGSCAWLVGTRGWILIVNGSSIHGSRGVRGIRMG